MDEKVKNKEDLIQVKSQAGRNIAKKLQKREVNIEYYDCNYFHVQKSLFFFLFLYVLSNIFSSSAMETIPHSLIDVISGNN